MPDPTAAETPPLERPRLQLSHPHSNRIPLHSRSPCAHAPTLVSSLCERQARHAAALKQNERAVRRVTDGPTARSSVLTARSSTRTTQSTAAAAAAAPASATTSAPAAAAAAPAAALAASAPEGERAGDAGNGAAAEDDAGGAWAGAAHGSETINHSSLLLLTSCRRGAHSRCGRRRRREGRAHAVRAVGVATGDAGQGAALL